MDTAPVPEGFSGLGPRHAPVRGRDHTEAPGAAPLHRQNGLHTAQFLAPTLLLLLLLLLLTR
ncbi:hypothetical protein AB0H29_26620 [Streptomyces thermolilacinus]